MWTTAAKARDVIAQIPWELGTGRPSAFPARLPHAHALAQLLDSTR
jgi:hypothetical protein